MWLYRLLLVFLLVPALATAQLVGIEDLQTERALPGEVTDVLAQEEEEPETQVRPSEDESASREPRPSEQPDADAADEAEPRAAPEERPRNPWGLASGVPTIVLQDTNLIVDASHTYQSTGLPPICYEASEPAIVQVETGCEGRIQITVQPIETGLLEPKEKPTYRQATVTDSGFSVFGQEGALAGMALAGALIGWGLLRRLAMGALLFSRILPESLEEHPLRQEILETIQQEPGIYQQELQRRVGAGTSTLLHHIKKLEQGGRIRRVQKQGFVCYFDRRNHPLVQIEHWHGAHSETALDLYNTVRQRPGLSPKELAAQAGISASTACYHLRRLEENGAIRKVITGRSKAIFATQ